jgi:SAM-dependent methyltransferase
MSYLLFVAWPNLIFYSYYNLATDLYEYGWGASFHFCRFAYGEPFRQAIARHEHYLAHIMGIKEGMKVLDVGCGVGGPAREIVKFTGCNVVGLNNNDYQIERATRYAAKEGLSDKLSFTKGDFMVQSQYIVMEFMLTCSSKWVSLRIHSTPSMPSKLLFTRHPSKVSTAKYSGFSSLVVYLECMSGL